MSFWIESISALGEKKSCSNIHLKEGVNIICGPSNTGKTCIAKCIEYMFGSSAEPFSEETGYDKVQMIVCSENERYTMTRKFHETTIQVDHTGSKNETTAYNVKTSVKNYEKTINSFWLSLIGIDTQQMINSNTNFRKQILSWKSIYHIVVLSETRIISGKSIIFPESFYNDTAILSSLIYLLSGQSFSDADAVESKEIREAKKKALKGYIDTEVVMLTERSKEIEKKQNDFQDGNVDALIQTTLDEISDYNQKLTDATSKSQSVLERIQKRNQSLSECEMLLFKYTELMSQYKADLKRLSFIVDGELNSKPVYTTHCPICETAVSFSRKSRYIEAAQAEYRAIRLQVSDLEKAIKDLEDEKSSIEADIKKLLAEKEEIEKLIDVQLKPKLSDLRDKSEQLKEYISNQATIALIKSIVEKKEEERIAVDADNGENMKFHPKEHFEEDFYSDLGKIVKNLLEQCNYASTVSVVFDKTDMDVVINGKKKNSNGKGYNAFLNSVVAISLARYMAKHAKYNPHFLVLDSPILSLKESHDIKPSETMSSELFKCIVSDPIEGQTIIIENEIPDIDYSNVNLISFTKEVDSGRYGFLMDCTN